MVRFNGPYVFAGNFDENEIQPPSLNTGQVWRAVIDDRGVMVPHAWFTCPCGCGIETVIPIEGHKSNRGQGWHMEVDPETQLVTLDGSVQQNKEYGCGAHYFITKGMVHFC